MSATASATPVSAAPFVLAGFAAGIGWLQTRESLPRWPWAWLGAGMAIAAVVVLARRHAWLRVRADAPARWPRALPALLALAAAIVGFGYAAWRAEVRLADALPPAWEGVDVAIVGVVDDLPDASERGVRFAFAVERVKTPDAVVPRRLSLAWPAATTRDGDEIEVPRLRAGERWRLTVRLKRPHGYANPGGFDLEAWLLERNLRATGYVRASAGNTRVDAFAGRAIDHVQDIRERVRERIAVALPDAPYAGVVAALAIGDQRAIPDTQWTVFNRTGVGHLVSISGLHVTALAALAAGLAALLARRSVRLTDALPARSVGAIAAVAVAGVYTLLAGAEVPALRTFAMLAAGATGLVASRQAQAWTLWLWALAAVLALDPWAVLAPGCWLSFGAVAVLIYAAAGRVAPRRPARWRARLAKACVEGARTQWVVTVGLVPFTLVLFGQVSLVSPLANAIAIPLVTLAVAPLAVVGIVVPGDASFVVAHALLAPLMRLLALLADAPAAAWAQHTPLPWTLAAAAIGVSWLLAPRGVPGRTLGVLWLVPLFVAMRPAPLDGIARFTVLDVGQGLAVVVRTRTHALVYDTGPRWHDAADAGGRIVAPFLRHEGLQRLDLAVISHQDVDHAGGAASLLRTVPVERLLSSLPADHALVAGRPESAMRCEAGQRWRWDGVEFSVLHPPAWLYDDARARTNDLSCVLRVAAGQVRVLLAGDIEVRSEELLLRERSEALATDVLVVPHHGSRTSSTPMFVTAVDPSVAIFTAGYRNRFGHPRPDVVARYVARGAATLRTDLDGAITFDAGPARVANLERARIAWARYWREVPAARRAPLE